MKRRLIALAVVLVLLYVTSILWAREHLPALLPAR